jgi:hypothetical protein
MQFRRVASSGQVDVVEDLPYDKSTPAQLRCARHPGARCVFGALEDAEEVFYELDPARGRGRRLLGLPGPAPWRWDLSPDGARLVITHKLDSVRTVDLETGQVTEVIKDPLQYLESPVWIGDSRSFLVFGGMPGSNTIVRVDPGGVSRPIWTSNMDQAGDMRVSDDGREVTFAAEGASTDFWLLTPPTE